MVHSSEVSTTRGQRIMLWLITILMTVGTIGSFAMIVLANVNSQKDQEKYSQLQAEYQANYDEYEQQIEDLGALEKLEKYSETRVGEFDADSVTKLKTEDLEVGTGDEITEEDTFYAYYVGWNPEGVIFDQSIEDGELSDAIEASPGSVIEGWTTGVAGMKVGGIRELTIPSDLAYGETGSGDDIPANTPLKFIVMVVPSPPDPSDELLEYYVKLYGG